LGFGPNKGQSNHARFDLPAFNKLYEAQRALPDGPERLALIHQARDLMVAYMPYKIHAHRFSTDLVHPWVQGYHASHFRGLFWKYVDLDPAGQARQRAGK
jgi:ABC-type transport system substrate-binding protein